MNWTEYPAKKQWEQLCRRPAQALVSPDQIQTIFEEVAQRGDQALLDFTEQYDRVRLERLRYDIANWESVEEQVSPELQAAIRQAKQNINTFHAAQARTTNIIETAPGVQCWQREVPIEKVGLYIPGGTAPLFSTLLMLGIPARLAGCRKITLVTPPNREGQIHPAILFTARELGIENIFAVGGAQAIAAMSLGTESIPKVDKIFGPGNAWVTAAKEYAQQQGIAIDMPAGPSEVMVVADDSANPAFVAADLLSQAEHGADSQVMLVSDSKSLCQAVEAEIQQQLVDLPRREVAEASLQNSHSILLPAEELMAFSNTYAPEHLILASEQPEKWVQQVQHAGSVFIGNYACESAGDYASGTNHTLPTYGYARQYSGLTLGSFSKTITFQQLNARGIESIGNTVVTMARAEALEAHARAMEIRQKSLTS